MAAPRVTQWSTGYFLFCPQCKGLAFTQRWTRTEDANGRAQSLGWHAVTVNGTDSAPTSDPSGVVDCPRCKSWMALDEADAQHYDDITKGKTK